MCCDIEKLIHMCQEMADFVIDFRGPPSIALSAGEWHNSSVPVEYADDQDPGIAPGYAVLAETVAPLPHTSLACDTGLPIRSADGPHQDRQDLGSAHRCAILADRAAPLPHTSLVFDTGLPIR